MGNPELIRQTVQNPIVQQLMMNPTVLNELITAHPQAKDWLKVMHISIWWLGSVARRMLVLLSKSQQFDSHSGCCTVVIFRMGDSRHVNQLVM